MRQLLGKIPLIQNTRSEIAKSVAKRSAYLLSAVAQPQGDMAQGVISVALGLSKKGPIRPKDLVEPLTLTQYLDAEGLVLYLGMSPGMTQNFTYSNGRGKRFKYKAGSQEFKNFIESNLSPIAPVTYCPPQQRPAGPREKDDEISFIGGSHVRNAGCAEKQIMYAVMETGEGGLLGISNTAFPYPDSPDKSLHSYIRRKPDGNFYICPCKTCQVRLDHYGIKNFDL